MLASGTYCLCRFFQVVLSRSRHALGLVNIDDGSNFKLLRNCNPLPILISQAHEIEVCSRAWCGRGFHQVFVLYSNWMSWRRFPHINLVRSLNIVLGAWSKYLLKIKSFSCLVPNPIRQIRHYIDFNYFWGDFNLYFRKKGIIYLLSTRSLVGTIMQDNLFLNFI